MSDSAEDARALRARVARWLLGGLAVLFGIATVVEGGHVLFGGPVAREEAGHVVPFVLGFNFGAGFVYMLGGAGTALGRRWALWIARTVAVATLLVFAAFGLHVLSGGAYEKRTALAMALRTGFWLLSALFLDHFRLVAPRRLAQA
jgi:hypothetical protein